MAILILAMRIPAADGLNVTSKLVVPVVAATGEVGCKVTVKSAELVP